MRRIPASSSRAHRSAGGTITSCRSGPIAQPLSRSEYRAVAKHKSVDAIVRVRCRRISGPLQEQQVAIEELGLQCPGCVRQISKQLGEPRPDTFLATQDPLDVMKTASSA
jgi:hypothetical protein